MYDTSTTYTPSGADLEAAESGFDPDLSATPSHGDLAAASDCLAITNYSNAELEEQLCSWASQMSAGECHLISLIGELDRREAWGVYGIRSCAHWLNWRLGTSLGAAREQVRVSRALFNMPHVRERFFRGEISYSKVRAITRVTDPLLEDTLLEFASYTTASQLENIVRRYRAAAPEEGIEAMERSSRRYFRSYDDEDGMVVIRARLTREDAGIVLAAIESARQTLFFDRGRGPNSTNDDPTQTCSSAVGAETEPVGPREPREHEVCDADALVFACESLVANGITPGHSGGVGVFVHVDAGVLKDEGSSGCSYVKAGGTARSISSHSAMRLGCSAAVTEVVPTADGSLRETGTTRHIPKRMREEVLSRDEGCRWPGCTMTRFVDLHHVVYFSRGGKSTADNLVSTCRFHHRLVHEGGYRLEMPSPGEVVVYDQEGRLISSPRAPIHPKGPGIEERNGQVGLSIDDETLSYFGESFDMGLTIDSLLCIAHPEAIFGRSTRPEADLGVQLF